ncbi:uncharacterized protein LOC128209005 [Mya arenaria]|uniref:uncharacterized protein LOC128209005 n=1 Tax=Mya arenaria TaxID=6604 RepID=UPI0022E2352E|nr:uncharacterized protein LOC128209005 [Mya arenaria]
MKGRKGPNRFRQEKDDAKFETEAFAYLNEDTDADTGRPNKIKRFDSDDELSLSEQEESGPEDNPVEDAPVDDTGSDDEAPEDVGFHDSKQSVLAQLKSAMRQVDTGKARRKELRKKMDAQFKEQKAKKKEDLAKSKLPEDFLESLDEKIPQKSKVVKGKRKQKKLEESGNSEEDETIKSVQKKIKISFKEDFISLTDSVSGVEVADVRKVEKRGQSQVQTAADFRNNRLYGTHVRRESNKKRMAKAEKRKQIGR